MYGSGSSEVRTPIFSGENYEFWRIKMVTVFKSLGLWNLVEKGITTPDSKKKKKETEESSVDIVDEEMNIVFMKDAKALGIIQNAVSDQIFPQIANADSGKMVWDLLYGEYHGGGQVISIKLQNLRRQFEYARMRDDESLSGYLTRLNELINRMKTFGESLSNERLVQKVLINLSKPYDSICLVIENTKCLETVKLQKVIAILKSQEQQFDLHIIDTIGKAFTSLSVSPKGQNRSGAQSDPSQFQKNWNYKGKKWDSKPKFQYKGKPKCYNCERFGHWARECIAGKSVQKANNANQIEVTRNLFYANSTISESVVNGEWYVDSGCNNHMTGNEKLLVDIRTNKDKCSRQSTNANW
ncbi:uncharacterized protein [Pyrus communis]|uniref:uncharacterized protein n=1 Tax=Pyrus communis TaxID=23211 RepID=UPI0035C215D8